MNKSVQVYSFDDHRVVLSHPDVGTMVLSDGGIGRITISYSGENARLTTSADGGTTINKINNDNGVGGIDVIQTSDANQWLKKWVNYLKQAGSDRFALSTLIITDLTGKDNVTCSGVVPQKMADLVFDAEAQMRNWPVLMAQVDMK